MRKEERLLGALSDVDAELIADAGRKPSRTKPWRGLVAMAACLALVVGMLTMGGRGGGAGGGMVDGTLRYDVYMGPVMPLTVFGSGEGLTAKRDVTFDFSYYGEINHEIIRIHTDVTDAYTLCNTTEEDVTVELAYPFVAKLQDKELLIPRVTVDGESAKTTLTVGDDLQNGSLMDSGEKLTAALSDGTYLTEAFGDAPVLDMPCTVYRIGDLDYDGEVIGEGLTLEFGFPVDLEQTKVLVYQVGAIRHETKAGRFSVRMGLESKIGNKAGYVILLGEDIDGYTLQGYSTSKCEEGTEVDGFTAEVTRTETTLGEWMASEIDWAYWQKIYNDGRDLSIAYKLSLGDIQRYAAEQLLGGKAFNPIEDEQIVMLDEYLSAALYAQRVMYVSFPVTVPAGEAVTVSAQSVKYSSPIQAGRNEELHGYELMMQLGSTLCFTEQTVAFVNTEGVEYVSSNLFNGDGAVWETVTLDPSVEQYWLRVQSRRAG